MMPGGTNLPVLGGLGRGSRTPYPYDAYPPRPSQATHAIPDPYPEFLNEPHSSGKLIALPVLGGVQHDYRLAA